MYIWAVFIHILLAAFWIGGMLFTVAVLVPATRGTLKANKALLFTELGSRFSRLTWIIFPLMILTGILALIGRGFSLPDLSSSAFWNSPYGATLQTKLIIFGLIIIISGIHDFWLGPKAAELIEMQPDYSRTRRFQMAARWIGRLTLLAGAAIVYFAVSLVRW